MPFIIVLLILIILLMGLLLVGYYYKMIEKNKVIKNKYQGIRKLFNFREGLVKKFLESIVDNQIDNHFVIAQIYENLEKFKIITEIQDIVNLSLELSELLDYVIAVYKYHGDESIKNIIEQLINIEKDIRMSWYCYNASVVIYNQWILSFPRSIFTFLLGVEPLAYILLDEE